jgi:hypothetical protein
MNFSSPILRISFLIWFSYGVEWACSTFYVMAATSAKFGLHVGNKKFHAQKKE